LGLNLCCGNPCDFEHNVEDFDNQVHLDSYHDRRLRIRSHTNATIRRCNEDDRASKWFDWQERGKQCEGGKWINGMLVNVSGSSSVNFIRSPVGFRLIGGSLLLLA
jgi:hypothetical protein